MKILKLVLALLFFICLLDMPYGYYMIVRFSALIGFSILAFQSYQSKNQILTIIYVCLALLFQPFVKVALGRELWNVVDVIAGIFLIFTIIKSVEKK